MSFAPYVGELAIAVTLFVVSMVTFDTLGKSIIAPISYLLLMSSVHLAVPFIVRRRLLLNPVAIFVGIIFLGWIRGIPGALLAVPLLASFKTICERVGPLNPIAAFDALSPRWLGSSVSSESRGGISTHQARKLPSGLLASGSPSRSAVVGVRLIDGKRAGAEDAQDSSIPAWSAGNWPPCCRILQTGWTLRRHRLFLL